MLTVVSFRFVQRRRISNNSQARQTSSGPVATPIKQGTPALQAPKRMRSRYAAAGGTCLAQGVRGRAQLGSERSKLDSVGPSVGLGEGP